MHVYIEAAINSKMKYKLVNYRNIISCGTYFVYIYKHILHISFLLKKSLNEIILCIDINKIYLIIEFDRVC